MDAGWVPGCGVCSWDQDVLDPTGVLNAAEAIVHTVIPLLAAQRRITRRARMLPTSWASWTTTMMTPPQSGDDEVVALVAVDDREISQATACTAPAIADMSVMPTNKV